MQTLSQNNSTRDGVAGTLPALRITYGSQTGNAEFVALGAAKAAQSAGLETTLTCLDEIDVAELSATELLLLVTSTYNDAEMPDNAADFWAALSESQERLEGLRFAVLALGDSMYEEFCWAGRMFDERLEELGATRLLPRLDCDIDFDVVSVPWVERAVQVFHAAASGELADTDAPAEGKAAASPAARSRWTKKSPFQVRILQRRVLTAPRAAKTVCHYELDVTAGDLGLTAGDSIGVVVENPPELVADLLAHLGVSPSTVLGGQSAPVRDVLLRDLELRLPPRGLVSAVARASTDPDFVEFESTASHDAVEEWLWGKDVLDVLRLVPTGTLSIGDVISELRPLAHRAYSLASSPIDQPDIVAITVAEVLYPDADRIHRGAGTSHLARHAELDGTIAIFPLPNPAFRLPAPEKPIIMIGPGTGIAPFRAFLREREHQHAPGRSWLFAGARNKELDWLYGDELSTAVRTGRLTHLSVAFSRDQAEKRYVQHLMLEESERLFAWIEDGAHIYVCGDQKHMAGDVERTLLTVIAESGGMAPEKAVEYLDDLKLTKRYQQDVY